MAGGMDVGASALALALGISVSEVLQRADDEINRVVAEQGLDAARGLTTRQKGGSVFLSPRLADALAGTSS